MIELSFDWMDTVVGAGVGVLVGGWLATIGARPRKWELDTEADKAGIVIKARKGSTEITLHKVGYDRMVTRNPEEEFDQQFAEALSRSRSTIRSLNAADRKEPPYGMGG